MKITVKRDNWVCRDSDGLLHAAFIARSFDEEGRLVKLEGATACRPHVSGQLVEGTGWHGKHLPSFTLGNQWGKDRITLVEYWVREAPTCVRCAVLAQPVRYTRTT